jgi:hypothetical protein
MSKASGKRSQKLEVQIMFEPSRLEQDYLHKAYTCLIPVLYRRLAKRTRATQGSAQARVDLEERSML